MSLFGVGLSPAASPTVGDWVRSECDPEWGTVGSIIPSRFRRIVRVPAPEPNESWWSDYRARFTTIASICAWHTATPDELTFAIWEGHGFVSPAGALDGVPRLELPDRTYLLVEGGEHAVGNLRYPGYAEWRNPDLVWPGDRSWLIATDVDFWSLYVAGPPALVDEVLEGHRPGAEPVSRHDRLVLEV